MTPASPSRETDQDDILATKLHVPVAPGALVVRQRLRDRLHQPSGLVLVSAPAGYGKSVVLADWAHHHPGPVAWVTLDVADSDPARFWRHLVAALEPMCPGIWARLDAYLDTETTRSPDAFVTRLINEIVEGAADTAVLLMLDDYHVITTAAVHDGLRFLVDHRPEALTVVVATRADPPLGLARLRARAQLVELRADELRFTTPEAAELLRRISHDTPAELSDDAVAALTTRTEGWAAGLQLAALSLRGRTDVAEFVASFTGTNRFVLDYLAEEVLERQPARVRDFLVDTSVLGQLSGSLCDAVTEAGDSQSMLEELDRAGLFVIPLDTVRGWWRYHHLFAELLRGRLTHGPDRERRVHARAAAWYGAHGFPDEAITHALSAREPLWAARLVEEHFDEVYNLDGDTATTQRWLASLPAETVWSRPRLLLADSLLAAIRGDVADVEPRLDAAESALEGLDEDGFAPSAGTAASMLVNIPALIAQHRSYLAQVRGDVRQTVAFADRARALSRPGEQLLTSTTDGFLAVAAWLDGRLVDAARAFAAGIAGWQAGGQVATVAWAVHQLGQVHAAAAHADEAEQMFARLVNGVPADQRMGRPDVGAALVGLAELGYQRDDLDAAAGYVTEGIAVNRQFVYTGPLAAGLTTLAKIRQASGDVTGARRAMGEAPVASPGPAGVLNPVPADRARLLLAQGELDTVRRWVAGQELPTVDDSAYPREPAHLVHAQLLLAEQDPAGALRLLDQLRALAVEQHRDGSLVQIDTLAAVALAHLGRSGEAAERLAGVLAVAAPAGYLRVFLDAGPAVGELVRRLATRPDGPRPAPRAYLARVRRAFEVGPGGSVGADRVGTAQRTLVDPLTLREQEVLALLADGASNQLIATRLFVTVDTVKRHVSHILTKLGATNRTEAARRARELGLVP